MSLPKCRKKGEATCAMGEAWMCQSRVRLTDQHSAAMKKQRTPPRPTAAKAVPVRLFPLPAYWVRICTVQIYFRGRRHEGAESKTLNWNTASHKNYENLNRSRPGALFFSRSLGIKKSVLAIVFHRIQGRGNFGSLNSSARFNCHIIALIV